ncbi:MAG: VRR-NUC domain-containing protein [Shewanella fodinae]|nr:VRR-NUC domain-containing protein [Shewanella fodinae]
MAVFQRILRDPQHYRSGHPDLLLFTTDGQPQFVEVKVQAISWPIIKVIGYTSLLTFIPPRCVM